MMKIVAELKNIGKEGMSKVIFYYDSTNACCAQFVMSNNSTAKQLKNRLGVMIQASYGLETEEKLNFSNHIREDVNVILRDNIKIAIELMDSLKLLDTKILFHIKDVEEEDIQHFLKRSTKTPKVDRTDEIMSGETESSPKIEYVSTESPSSSASSFSKSP